MKNNNPDLRIKLISHLFHVILIYVLIAQIVLFYFELIAIIFVIMPCILHTFTICYDILTVNTKNARMFFLLGKIGEDFGKYLQKLDVELEDELIRTELRKEVENQE